MLQKVANVRPNNKEDLTEEEATEAITEALRVLYYRDARASLKYQLAVINNEGVRVSGPLYLKTNWGVAHVVSGYD